MPVSRGFLSNKIASKLIIGLRHAQPVLFVSCFLVLAALASQFQSPAEAGIYVECPVQTEILHDGNLHIFFLGTGNPEGELENVRKPACLALVADGRLFFIDAGEGAIQTAAGLGLPYDLLSKVFM